MPPIRRVRQHVNPLSSKYANPADAPDWNSVFKNPRLPLHLDIGCGKGDFVREMAKLMPEWNFLGLEIREPLVERALIRRDQAKQSNLHFVFCNANNSLKPLLSSWPGGCPLQRVSIQFPDPWFKKRHQKRRVVQSALVAVLAELMPSQQFGSPSGAQGEAIVWLQSDIEEVCEEMCDRFSENPAFGRTEPHWLAESPFPALSDRERVCEEKELPIYRAKYIRQ
ncbi:MAG: tRNA (guanosine(46)-N7)-methyltransferase TrmB [Phormidesmis sp.]